MFNHYLPTIKKKIDIELLPRNHFKFKYKGTQYPNLSKTSYKYYTEELQKDIETTFKKYFKHEMDLDPTNLILKWLELTKNDSRSDKLKGYVYSKAKDSKEQLIFELNLMLFGSGTGNFFFLTTIMYIKNKTKNKSLMTMRDFKKYFYKYIRE